MKRREFMTLLIGVAAGPLTARAQQADRKRRIGVLMGASADEPETRARFDAFVQGLEQLGWADGHNVQIDTLWGTEDLARLRKDATQLVARRPDVLLAGVGATTSSLQQATHTVPIVFAQGLDPVGAFQIESLAQPGNNTTGFIQLEYNLSGKWLELLKEVSPAITRVAILREPGAAGIGQWAVISAAATALRVDLTPIDLHDARAIETAVSTFARKPNGGLIVVVSAASLTHRNLIVTLAARHRLPTVYFNRAFVTAGGLISYGANVIEQYRRAAGYVDRILKGENAGDLPVQTPTKYKLVVNLKTAKSLGLAISLPLLGRADEVIE
jgi:putative ABC transport system substrate-binding protein